MAASEACIVQGEDSPTTAGPVTASPRWPQLIPMAQLVAVVLSVLAIIWNQQQTTDSLRSELRAEIGGVRTEMGELRTEIGELRTEVSENGQRLARIEGFLGIGIPETATPP